MGLRALIGLAGSPWFFGKFLHSVNFLFYRIAAWTGTLYLWRKGKNSRYPYLYRAAAVLVYAASWAVLIISYEELKIWISHRLIHRIHLP